MPKVSGGNTNDYSYTDATVGDRARVIYYRIREMDIDGSYLFSNIILIKSSAHIAKLTITPNPAATSATLSFMTDHTGSVSIRLIGMAGNPVWSNQYQARQGTNTLLLDHLQQLPDGIYVLQVYDGKDHEQKKIFIRH